MYLLLFFLVFLSIVILSIWLSLNFFKTRRQLKQADLILDAIAAGNLDRQILVHENDLPASLCYKINEIVRNTKTERIAYRTSELAYRRLVTSLSHDLRTPLASLIGYLNAMEDGILEKEETESAVRLSLEKAFDLKNYIDTLFEWLKLESGEQIFCFEELDILELTREILTEWIPRMEQASINYEFEIPETEFKLFLDPNAYRRILDNLLQNIFLHSHADTLSLQAHSAEQTIKLQITDNGTGISEADLPFIFDRLYRCDTARSQKGNGLGLSIVKELVRLQHGTVSVSSSFGVGTTFLLTFSKNSDLS